MDEMWRSQANCLRAPDPTIFDELTPSEASITAASKDPHPRIAEAVAYCVWCPVKAECIGDAMKSTDFPISGVRGGIYIGVKAAKGHFSTARKAAGIYNTRSSQTHCPQNHEFTPENTRTQPNGSRSCIACNRARSVARRRREAA